jgi:hypothetical protein
MVQRATNMSRSVRIAEDEARWLTAAADNDGVGQNDLIRLDLHRLRQELGAANRKKRDTTVAAAQAVQVQARVAGRSGGQGAPAAAKMTSPATASEKTASASAITRAAGKRARES